MINVPLGVFLALTRYVIMTFPAELTRNWNALGNLLQLREAGMLQIAIECQETMEMTQEICSC